MKELFDPITLNWFRADSRALERTQTTPTVGKVFKTGFNDPTYRTFRIEFGDWGASLYDNSVLVKKESFKNLMHMDYDSYPAGLLDTYYLDKTNADIFPYTQTYSAYRYLKNRNEDTRAEYLRLFIMGIYEIQHKYPYIFQDISGIDLLNQFDKERGQRIDKAEITLTCYEGLSLKMQTLMELYRKAAWDDVYQRWVLPLNMREFKMIIYVFERRTFHLLASDGWFEIADYVADLPVYAFECEPCEFVIENHMKPEYSLQYLKNTDYETTAIKIQVKNLKTYLKNGLMRGDKSMTKHLLIYDLMDKIERQETKGKEIFAYVDKHGQSESLSTVNSYRAVYLTKEMLLSNETSDFKSYGERQAGFLGQANLGEDHPLASIEEPKLAYEWHRATVTGPDYWSSSIKGDIRNLFKKETWQEIGYKMLNVIVSGTTLIKVAPMYGQLLSSMFKNVLQGIEISPLAMYVSYATTGPVGPMKHIDERPYKKHRALNKIEKKINAVRELTTYDIDDPVKVEKQQITQPDLNYKVEPMTNMTKVDKDYKVLPMDELTNLDDYKVNPMDHLNVLDEKVNKITPTFDNIQEVKYNPQDIETKIDPAHEQPGLYVESIEKSLHINTFHDKVIDDPHVKPNMSDVHINGNSGLTINKDEVKVENIEGLNDEIQNITATIDNPSEHKDVDMNLITDDRKENKIKFNEVTEIKKAKPLDFNEMTEVKKSKPLDFNEINNESPVNEVKLNEIVNDRKSKPVDFKQVEAERKTNEIDFNEINTERKTNKIGLTNIDDTVHQGEVSMKQIDEPGKRNEIDLSQIDEPQEGQPIDLPKIEQPERNVAINKLKTLDNIARPPRSELIQLLIEFDKEATKNEQIIQNTIIEGNVQVTGDETSKLLQIFAENREGFQESFANRVIALKNTLIDQNKTLVKNIPDVQIDTNTERQNIGLATIEETERIKSNAILTGLADEDIRKMSLSTLIALNDQLVESLDDTAGLNKRPINTKIDKTKARDKRLIGGHVIEDPIKTK